MLEALPTVVSLPSSPSPKGTHSLPSIAPVMRLHQASQVLDRPIQFHLPHHSNHEADPVLSAQDGARIQALFESFIR